MTDTRFAYYHFNMAVIPAKEGIPVNSLQKQAEPGNPGYVGKGQAGEGGGEAQWFR